MSIIACAPRAARYSAAGMTRSIASSYPAALNDRRAMPRAMNVIPGYMTPIRPEYGPPSPEPPNR